MRAQRLALQRPTSSASERQRSGSLGDVDRAHRWSSATVIGEAFRVGRHEARDVHAGAVDQDLAFEAALSRFAGRALDLQEHVGVRSAGAGQRDGRQDAECARKLRMVICPSRPRAVPGIGWRRRPIRGFVSPLVCCCETALAAGVGRRPCLIAANGDRTVAERLRAALCECLRPSLLGLFEVAATVGGPGMTPAKDGNGRIAWIAGWALAALILVAGSASPRCIRISPSRTTPCASCACAT